MTSSAAARKTSSVRPGDDAFNDAATLSAAAIELGESVRAMLRAAGRVRFEPEGERGRCWRREEIEQEIRWSKVQTARAIVLESMFHVRRTRHLTRRLAGLLPPGRFTAALDLLTRYRYEPLDTTPFEATSAVEALLNAADRINSGLQDSIREYWRRRTIGGRSTLSSIRKPSRGWLNEASWREAQTNFLPFRARLLRRRDWSFHDAFRVLSASRERFDPNLIRRAIAAARIELERVATGRVQAGQSVTPAAARSGRSHAPTNATEEATTLLTDRLRALTKHPEQWKSTFPWRSRRAFAIENGFSPTLLSPKRPGDAARGLREAWSKCEDLVKWARKNRASLAMDVGGERDDRDALDEAIDREESST